MFDETRAIVSETIRDLRRSWRSLVLADIVYKAVAFALLTPATMLVLRWMIFSDDTRAFADTDIATFFLTTPTGILVLVVGGAIIVGITALEVACLMAIGLAAAKGRRLDVKGSLAFAAVRARRVLRLTATMVVRVLAGLLPFALAAGLAYWALLRDYDINYYLAQRPPAFWAAAVIAGAIGAALAAFLVRTVARWALALPLVVFENVAPGRALGESATRSAGARPVVVLAVASWAVVAVVLLFTATALPEVIGRGLAPQLRGSLAPLLLFVTGLALLWAALGLGAGVLNAALLALVLIRLYLRVGEPQELQVPGDSTSERSHARVRIPRAARFGVAAIAVFTAVGIAVLFVTGARRNLPVVVIGHRGSSAGPENTLAAFRLGAEQGADSVEFDVQESRDGEVLVVHDSDLMKVGGSSLKIWQADAAQLRAVDIGSRAGSQFSGERVPTLAEALAVCKGRSRVIVELKSYGHNQHLEERVVAIVEAAGMVDDAIFMSLDHAMVRKMKQLRPSWRTGVLVAKAIGDVTSLGGDFLAVEGRLATRDLVRRAHRAGQDVYVWTVDDPANMLAAMSRGVDGLITNRPDLAREVVTQRAAMSDAQRVLVALLVRLGVREEALAAEDALRP